MENIHAGFAAPFSEERNGQTISDALELIPSATTGEGQLTSFREFSYLIRGQTARILRDGVRHRFFGPKASLGTYPMALEDALQPPD